MLYHIFDLRFVKLAAEALYLAHIEYVTRISTYNGMALRLDKSPHPWFVFVLGLTSGLQLVSSVECTNAKPVSHVPGCQRLHKHEKDCESNQRDGAHKAALLLRAH